MTDRPTGVGPRPLCLRFAGTKPGGMSVSAPMESVRTLIVGAGMSGLATAAFLRDSDYLVLERDAVPGLGAAVGAALPHTAQEDELLGEQADKLRGKAAKQAGKLYEQGKEKAAELYEDASAQAGEIYGDVKDKVADITNGQGGTPSMSRH